jgi:hypothetical protein
MADSGEGRQSWGGWETGVIPYAGRGGAGPKGRGPGWKELAASVVEGLYGWKKKDRSSCSVTGVVLRVRDTGKAKVMGEQNAVFPASRVGLSPCNRYVEEMELKGGEGANKAVVLDQMGIHGGGEPRIENIGRAGEKIRGRQTNCK